MFPSLNRFDKLRNSARRLACINISLTLPILRWSLVKLLAGIAPESLKDTVATIGQQLRYTGRIAADVSASTRAARRSRCRKIGRHWHFVLPGAPPRLLQSIAAVELFVRVGDAAEQHTS